MEIQLRTPCLFHANCDETAVRVLHRSSSEGQPRPDESFCELCEGVLQDLTRAARAGATEWRCPACGFTHRLNGKQMVPALSIWPTVLQVTKKETNV